MHIHTQAILTFRVEINGTNKYSKKWQRSWREHWNVSAKHNTRGYQRISCEARRGWSAVECAATKFLIGGQMLQRWSLPPWLFQHHSACWTSFLSAIDSSTPALSGTKRIRGSLAAATSQQPLNRRPTRLLCFI